MMTHLPRTAACIRRSTVPRRWTVLLPLLLATACSGTNVVLDTAAGVTPIYTPPGPDGLAAPPPGLQNLPPQAPFAVGDRSGTYAGTAVPLVTGGGICIDNRPVSDFRVRGNSVRYGGYRG